MSSDQERRHLRVSVKLRVRIRNEEGEEFLFFTRNVSLGGLFLLIQPPLQTESQLAMELLTGRDAIAVQGRVVRSEEYGCAFEFRDVDAATAERLRSLIATLLERSATSVQSIAHSRVQDRSTSYWIAEGARPVCAHLTKLSEEGAHLTATSSPELYERIRVLLPADASSDGERLAGCDAQVIDRRGDTFSVVFLDRGHDFLTAVQTLLQPPRRTDSGSSAERPVA